MRIFRHRIQNASLVPIDNQMTLVSTPFDLFSPHRTTYIYPILRRFMYLIRRRAGLLVSMFACVFSFLEESSNRIL